METCDDFVVVTDRRAVPGPAVGDQDRARGVSGAPDNRLVAYQLGVGCPAGRPRAPIRAQVMRRGHQADYGYDGSFGTFSATTQLAGVGVQVAVFAAAAGHQPCPG
ncbi:hypothetical protein A4G27_18120 [Mycobacterium kansasii]|nr:hypothetical protein A4G27_18120 [Mycobacterium kansasii]